MLEREPGDVPAGWRHPDEVGTVRHGVRGQRIVVGVVIAVLAVLLIITLILLAVAFARYSSFKCLGTESYFVQFLDENAVYNESFRPGSPDYESIRAKYQKDLQGSTTEAGYAVYRIQINSFSPATPSAQRLYLVSASTKGVNVYGTVTIEASEGNFPGPTKFGDDLKPHMPNNQTVERSDTNPSSVCPGNEPFIGSTTAQNPDTTTASCPPVSPCPTDCPTLPTDHPSRPTIPVSTFPPSSTTTTGTTTTGTTTTTTGTTTPYTPTTTMPPIPGNETCADILFIVDESEVLLLGEWQRGWEELKHFMITTVQQYTVGLDQTRFAVVGFGTRAFIQVPFSQSTSQQHVIELIRNITLISEDPALGARNVTDGFLKGYDAYFPLRSPASCKYAIFVPAQADDASSTSRAVAAAKELASLDVKLYIAQVDYEIDPFYVSEIEQINAGYQAVSPNNVFLYANLSGFGNLTTVSLQEDLKYNVGNSCVCVGLRCVADIVLLVDQSTSIDKFAYYTYIVPFLKHLTNGLDISDERSHLAMVRFCNPADTDVVFDFNSPQNIPFIHQEIDKSYYCTGTTSLEKALNLTYTNVFTDHGVRPIEYLNVSRIALIITDGMATDATGPNHTIPTVQLLMQDLNVTIFAVGVGADLTPEYLEKLTGQPDMRNVFALDDLQHLESAVNDIINKTNCTETPEPPTPTPTITTTTPTEPPTTTTTLGPTTTTTTPGPTPPALYCYNETDIVLVVEDSSVASAEDITHLQRFLIDFASQFVLGTDYAHLALQFYDSTSSVLFNLNTFTDTQSAVNAIRNYNFVRGTNTALIGAALEYTYSKVLTTEHGDRSCLPDVVILVSYSSTSEHSNPADADKAREVATKLRTAGALVFPVGVGPSTEISFLKELAGAGIPGYPGLFLHVPAFSDLQTDDYLQDVVDGACWYMPPPLYPCEVQDTFADIVFVVDTSARFAVYSDAVITYIARFLLPYQFSDVRVRAALVIYSDQANISISLTATTSYSSFISQVRSVLTNPPLGRERNIASALNLVNNNVLTTSGGYRPSAHHVVIVLAVDCFTGPDPLPTAQAIRLKPAVIYAVTLGVNYLSYKELLDIAGDSQHVVIVRGPYVLYEIRESLPEQSWVWLCPDNCDFATTTSCPPCGSTTTESTTTESTTQSTTTLTESPTTHSTTPSTTTGSTSPSTTTETTTPSTTTLTTTESTTTHSTTPSTTTETTTPSTTTLTTTETTTLSTTTLTTTLSTTTESTTPSTTTVTTTPSSTTESTTPSTTTLTTTTTPTTTTETTTPSTTTLTTTESTTPSTTTVTTTQSTTTESTTPSTTTLTTSTSTTPSTTTETTTPSTTTITTTPSTTTESTTPSTTTSTSTMASTTPSPGCERCAADVAFLIDMSSSITPVNFDKYVKPFMANLSQGLDISEKVTHFSLIQFSDPTKECTRVDMHFNEHIYDPIEIYHTILNLSFCAGDTALYTALNLAYHDVFTAAKGARVSEYGNTTAAYIIIITDGIATDYDTGDASEIAFDMLNDAGIVIYAVGVGSLVTEEYLFALTNDKNRTYHVDQFEELTHELIDRILNDSCCPLNASKPEPRPPQKYCEEFDLIFLLDESESVNQQDPTNFDTLKQFMINMTDIFNVNLFRNTRVAAVGYGRDSVLHFNLDKAGSKQTLGSLIKLMDYQGGARNPGAGFQTVFNDVLPISRLSDGYPAFVIHIAEYSHDVPPLPVPIAAQVGGKGVIIFNVAVLAFQNDTIFATETQAIAEVGAAGSMVFNSSTYRDLFTAGIREHFLKIMDEGWLCANLTTTTVQPILTTPHTRIIEDDFEEYH